MKLIELAKVYDCKIVTNDFNLNKVAQLHGVEVLNINELANALKPVVLPGETMRVFILKEGKEFNQGVAYLDDGTMVVVDNARQMIARPSTSSSPACCRPPPGKMIFGRFLEPSAAAAQAATQSHVRATSSSRGGRRPFRQPQIRGPRAGCTQVRQASTGQQANRPTAERGPQAHSSRQHSAAVPLVADRAFGLIPDDRRSTPSCSASPLARVESSSTAAATSRTAARAPGPGSSSPRPAWR